LPPGPRKPCRWRWSRGIPFDASGKRPMEGTARDLYPDDRLMGGGVMKVVCAWCQQAGNFVVLREKEPPGDDISHGICDEHALASWAEARGRRVTEPLASGWPLSTNAGGQP